MFTGRPIHGLEVYMVCIQTEFSKYKEIFRLDCRKQNLCQCFIISRGRGNDWL